MMSSGGTKYFREPNDKSRVPVPKENYVPSRDNPPTTTVDPSRLDYKKIPSLK